MSERIPDRLCYRIPEGVSFERWNGGGEWVVFHTGTGETLRLSDAAVVVLETLMRLGPQTADTLAQELAGSLVEDPGDAAVMAATSEILRALAAQECIDEVRCLNSSP